MTVHQLQHPGWIIEVKSTGRLGARSTRWYVAIVDSEQAIAAVCYFHRIWNRETVNAVRALSQMELNMLALKPGEMWESPY